MSVERIVDRITHDAESEAERIVGRAREEADRLRALAAEEGKKKGTQILGAGREETTRLCAHILSQSRLNARKILREAREEAIRDVLDEARRQLEKIRDSPRYPEIFEELATEALNLLGRDSAELVIDSRDQALAESFVSGRGKKIPRCTISRERTVSAGGATVSSPDGMVWVKNTVEARMERLEREITGQVSRILFGDGGVSNGS
ncbi:MAG: V-type ATP synthase subunit E [Methanolinea sp.]|nr:V-type ATP synthase subunit E [Methanolinea sp.]